ncbi:FecR family protein [Hymenobacter sp. UV11]|uniref:FecR family protein n=1 Tax=Hymenobacter sp. UV11 TaxID=1849735 RepID=UPI00105D1F5B|nr:FecR family protein [Hymenobacter sp. UV11]TDN40211.1 hypothetical protein A8B98_15115 [Hymenobacter sp. UV11]TFZ64900.1 FecR family protein [Hymenobacter sp. UV11]
MMTQADFDAMLQRYLDGQSRLGEQRLVEQWSEQLGRAGHQPLPPHLREEVRTAMWQNITARTAEPAGPVVRPLWPAGSWRKPALRWAAAALLTAGAGALSWWLPRHQAAGLSQAAPPRWVQRTNKGSQPTALRLADGSLVNLYPHSSVRYLTGLVGQRREVYLAGQACFKVTKDPTHPFLVYTDKLVTTVLGTSFMVTAYANQKNTVAVREGRVAVQRRQGAELAATPAHPAAAGLLLLPNQQATYSASTKELAKNLVREPVQLTAEPLDFHNRPVAEVLTALEHAYGVNIVYDPAKLRDCTITISFGDESLFEQLDTLCKALDAKYKMANNAQILFESSGCKAS